MVSRGSCEARFPREQLPLHRPALSDLEDQRQIRREPSARTPRPGMSGTTSHPKPTRICPKLRNRNGKSASTRTIGSHSTREAVPVIIAFRRSSASGVLRRSSTTTLLGVHRRPLRGRTPKSLRRCRPETALARKRLGKDSIWRTQSECALSLRKEFVPLPLRALADADGWIRIGPIPKGSSDQSLANCEPDFEQLVVLKVKIAKALAENSRAEPLAGSLHRRANRSSFLNCSHPTSAPTSSKTKAIISATPSPMRTSWR